MFYSYCFDMYIDVRLSHLNKDYLLTYLYSVHLSPKWVNT